MVKLSIILALAIVGCDAQLDKTELGLPSGEGPRIVFNPLTLPFAEIPMPNDLALVENPNTATGMTGMVPSFAHRTTGYDYAKTS